LPGIVVLDYYLYLNRSFISKTKNISYSRIDVVCTPIYSF
jgi:hypothetical protein